MIFNYNIPNFFLGGGHQDQEHYREDRPRLGGKHHGQLLLSCRRQLC